MNGAPPPGYPDPPAYTPHPLHDPTFLPDPPESATGRLHPRAAVILGLKTHWHKWLFFCRLLSVFPELRFGIPMLWKLASFLLGDERTWQAFSKEGDPIFIFIEVMLAALWCAVSGYVSFFSMDLLMVRWLFHYTPMASIVRLITASFLYYLGSNCVLEFSSSWNHARRLLPAWVFIATVCSWTLSISTSLLINSGSCDCLHDDARSSRNQTRRPINDCVCECDIHDDVCSSGSAALADLSTSCEFKARRLGAKVAYGM